MGTTTWIGRKAERKHESESAASSALSLLKEKIVNAKDAALAYRELMKYRYKFLLGHKGRAETLVLSFPKEAFHHLAGLHKIGLSRVRNKKYALDSILDDEITVEDSRQVMSDRWDCVCDLKRMIESNSLVFRLQKKNIPWFTDPGGLFDYRSPVPVFHQGWRTTEYFHCQRRSDDKRSS